MAFHVGQRVVCVDGNFGLPPDGFWYHEFPVQKQTYTIDFIDPRGGVRLAEIKSLGSFWSHRFRPVVERKTSIAIFTALLNPINHKHLEGV